MVFEGEKDGQQSALKVFDPELVERFGKPTQLSRIERECRLIGERQPHLGQIFPGGECAESRHLYVAMEFIQSRRARHETRVQQRISALLQQEYESRLSPEEKRRQEAQRQHLADLRARAEAELAAEDARRGRR
jgi:hypothetical protein